MKDQTTLFDQPSELKPWQGGPSDPHTIARRSDPQTSKDAAGWIAPKTGTWRWKVLQEFRRERHNNRDGMTDFELEHRFPHARPSNIRTRRSELTAQGVVVNSGRKRPTDSGMDAIIWTLREGL